MPARYQMVRYHLRRQTKIGILWLETRLGLTSSNCWFVAVRRSAVHSCQTSSRILRLPRPRLASARAFKDFAEIAQKDLSPFVLSRPLSS